MSDFEAIPGMEPATDEVLSTLAELDQMIALNQHLPVVELLRQRRDLLMTNPQQYFEHGLEMQAKVGHIVDTLFENEGEI